VDEGGCSFVNSARGLDLDNSTSVRGGEDNTLEEREGQGPRDETSLGNVALLSELHGGDGPNTDALQSHRHGVVHGVGWVWGRRPGHSVLLSALRLYQVNNRKKEIGGLSTDEGKERSVNLSSLTEKVAGVAVDKTWFYWIDGQSGVVAKIHKDSAPLKVPPSAPYSPVRINHRKRGTCDV
jgi:hypothetical protein